MNEQFKQLALKSGIAYLSEHTAYFQANDGLTVLPSVDGLEEFAELIVRECLNKIETHRIPVGNSAAGEMACEWTYSAMKEIRDEIKQHFGVEE